MAIPTFTLEADFTTASGTAPDGTVVITPSSGFADLYSGDVVSSAPVTLTVDSNGEISVALYATDGPGITPTGVTYTVAVHLEGADQVTHTVSGAQTGTVTLEGVD